jgi:hypothetical protein
MSGFEMFTILIVNVFRFSALGIAMLCWSAIALYSTGIMYGPGPDPRANLLIACAVALAVELFFHWWLRFIAPRPESPQK